MPLKMLPVSKGNRAGSLRERKKRERVNHRSQQLHPIVLAEENLRIGNAGAGGDAADVVADVAMDEMMGATGHLSRARQRP